METGAGGYIDQNQGNHEGDHGKLVRRQIVVDGYKQQDQVGK